MKNVNINKAFELSERIYQSLKVKTEVWGDDSEEVKEMYVLYAQSNEIFAELFDMKVCDFITQQCKYILENNINESF